MGTETAAMAMLPAQCLVRRLNKRFLTTPVAESPTAINNAGTTPSRQSPRTPQLSATTRAHITAKDTSYMLSGSWNHHRRRPVLCGIYRNRAMTSAAAVGTTQLLKKGTNTATTPPASTWIIFRLKVTARMWPNRRESGP
jgi:hypothetical protein